MAESDLVDIMLCYCGGVDHMLTENKCPQNFHPLRQLVETVIQEANDDDDLTSRL